MSSGTYDGGLGDLAGADATCLTELTTNTTWMGYATANSNGQLVASKVHAFLCDGGACNYLVPLTKYYFANTGNSSAGGAYFMTDGFGIGPNDSADWAAWNYFGGSYTYWSNRTITSGTAWGAGSAGLQSNSCAAFTSNFNGYNAALVGQSASTNSGRWATSGSTAICDKSFYLVCFVNP